LALGFLRLLVSVPDLVGAELPFLDRDYLRQQIADHPLRCRDLARTVTLMLGSVFALRAPLRPFGALRSDSQPGVKEH